MAFSDITFDLFALQLFAGVALDGMVINPESKGNASYYGEGVTAEDILLSGNVQPTAEGQKLIETIKGFVT